MTSSNTERAWAAGLFEGEGWITDRDKNGVQIGLGMTDRDVVERFAEIAGYGNVRVKIDTRAEQNKTMFIWEAKKTSEVMRILSFMLPYFGVRRWSRAMSALTRLEGVHVRQRPV